MTEPLFQVGQVLRVREPQGFISAFANKIADRDAVVTDIILDYGYGCERNVKQFMGRIRVQFQKRNGRGKEFAEIMHQRDFMLKEQPDAS